MRIILWIVQVPTSEVTILINGVNSTSGSNVPGVLVEDIGKLLLDKFKIMHVEF